MGEQSVKSLSDLKERSTFLRHVLHDLDALDKMIERSMFEKGIQRIGAEQELCLVNRNWEPAPLGAEVIQAANDEHFTAELAKYNMEINLDPLELSGGCFREMEEDLRRLLRITEKSAKEQNLNVILTGILPTITPRHIDPDMMTSNPRFEEMNEVMRAHKGGDFELHIQGVDELITKHDSIVFEACNTSFQCHLQIEPEEMVDQFNWAQAIAGPVLALCANSPLLLGKELWAETRIALFQQSIDLRSSSTLIREQQPRVTFGTRWIKESVAEIFKEDIARFNFLIASDVERDSLEVLEEGGMPELKALRLHNGTIYRWNRPCYGVANGVAHLRIENRYIPAGPTVLDEMANFAFWVGLMKGMPDHYRKIWEKMSFRRVKANFMRAALSGMETKMQWMGKAIDTKDLILDELLPIAEEGLHKANIDVEDIRKYLGVIRQRVSTKNGAQWMKHAFHSLKHGHLKDVSLRRMTALMHQNQTSGIPVGEWQDAHPSHLDGHELKLEKIYQIMSTDLLTVHEHDLVDLVIKIMSWRKLHHIPVENEHGECVGIITNNDLNIEREKRGELGDLFASEIMKKEVITIGPNDEIADVNKLMQETGIGCVPVIYKGKLVGMITRYDLKELKI